MTKQAKFKLSIDNKAYLFTSTLDSKNKRSNCKLHLGNKTADISVSQYNHYLSKASSN